MNFSPLDPPPLLCDNCGSARFSGFSLSVDVERLKSGYRATPFLRTVCENGHSNDKKWTLPERFDPDAVRETVILRRGPRPHNGSYQRVDINQEHKVFPNSADGPGRVVYARTDQTERDDSGDEITIFVHLPDPPSYLR